MLPGTLYVIATPIGNLEDISLRALRVLREDVSRIACEDTRQTLKLLNHFEISKPLLSYHEHNEDSRTEELLSYLGAGESVALLSDAGTPLISDPGYRLVRSAIDRGYPVTPLPGASALLVALSGAGLPTESFNFAGFLPAKKIARQKALRLLLSQTATTIFFESPHRILESLQDISAALGDRPLVLARELTKVHEEFLRGTALSIRNELEKRGSIKGEITLVIGRSNASLADGDPIAEVEELENELGLDRMEAIKAVAKRRGLPKSEIYDLVARSGGKPAGLNPRHTSK